MEEELSSLKKLQEIDLATDALVDKTSSLEAEIKEKTKEFESIKLALKSTKEKLTAQQLSKKQLEGEVEANEQALKKHQGELNSLKSNDAYKAMLGEIEAKKQAIIKIEDRVISVMEAIESAEKELKEKEQVVKSQEGAVKAHLQELESEKAKLVEETAKSRAERETFLSTVPASLRDQYESIREKRGGAVVVPLVQWSCGGCRMKVTPAKYNEIKVGKKLVLCETCSRIIFWVARTSPLPSVPAK